MGRPIKAKVQIEILESAGEARLIGHTGLQQRPVYLVTINGIPSVWEQAIHFDDGEDHSHFYGSTISEAKKDPALSSLLPKEVQ